MTGNELAAWAEEIARMKTVYVMGCFGAPMTPENQRRYLDHHPYNRRPDRTPAIQASDNFTFGFDCVGLIKGILWGWDGVTPSYYGGADYQANDVPDADANRMLDLCSGVSSDFSNLQIGEALGMENHIGIYIGDGKAVESTPRWEDGVQVTAVHNIARIPGMNGRSWTRHGKLPWIQYETEVPAGKPDTGLTDFIRQVQKATGSVADGVAGSQTIRNTPTISRWVNDRHPVVEVLQKRLYDLGYTEVGKADGVTGPCFYDAVVRYQKDHGCYPDGIITAKNKTWRCLLGIE